jgi:peptidoglycan/xylan/chitin deacetylase (PgdA/CDA1 family)
MNRMAARSASIVVNSPISAGALSLLERFDDAQPDLLRVLTYHRVDDPQARPWLYPRIMVTPQAFDEQMRFLAANYRVLAMPELLELRQKGGSLPPRAVLVTFDDAYCDFAEHAWPILQRHGLPATLFVPTAFPDGAGQVFWWDRLYQAVTFTARTEPLATPAGLLPLASADDRSHVFSRLRDYVKSLPHVEAMPWVHQVCDELGAAPAQPAVLGWDALRRLAHEGVTLGAHTQTHPLLNRITPEQVWIEAASARDDLQREIGAALPIFAYPSGGFNAEVVAIMEQAGFTLAFTTENGLNDWRHLDALRLRRINVGWRTPLTLLRARLLSWTRYLN